MRIYERKYQKEILQLCSYFPIVAIIGARQVGKTTLVNLVKNQIGKTTIHLDLELDSDINKLGNAELFFKRNRDRCIVIDEIQLRPDIFPLMRSIVDVTGSSCQFIITGSASPDLLRQSTESLSGRIAYVEVQPFSVDELPNEIEIEQHWFRGGFPKSLFAPDELISSKWLVNFVRTYIERDLRMLGMQAEPMLLRRLWTMIAHSHGSVINYSSISNSLAISVNTVRKYFDFFENAFLIKRVPSFMTNVRKRMVKSPKIYLNDTGILHNLLGISSINYLFGDPRLGNSWEGYCMMQIYGVTNGTYDFSFYRTGDGSECDLVLSRGGKAEFAIEIKFSSNPKLTKGNSEAFKAINAKNNYVVIPEGEAYPLRENVDAIGIREFISMMQKYNDNN